MPSEVCLLLALIGGFWLVFRTQFLRLTVPHLPPPFLGFVAPFYGVCLGVLGRLTTCFLHQVPWFQPIESFVRELFPWNFIGTGFAALAWAMILAECCNWLLSKGAVNARIIELYGSEVLRMLHEAMFRVKPVKLTLDNGEVYVGFVQRVRSIEGRNASVRILRLGSGYRDPRAPVPEIVYESIPLGARADELLTAFRLEAVQSVSFFMPDAQSQDHVMAASPQEQPPGV